MKRSMRPVVAATVIVMALATVVLWLTVRDRASAAREAAQIQALPQEITDTRPVASLPLLPPGAQILSNLEYARPSGKPLLLDLYLPQDTQGRKPVVVWVHGGGWMTGSRERPPVLSLVRRGYAVASISYRFSDEAVFPAQINDCKAAVRWLRASASKYGLDPRRIGVWGSSAGGHLAALLGTSGGVTELEGDRGGPDLSSQVQAVCDFCGPADFLAPDVLDGRAWQLLRDVAARLLGGPISSNREKAASASPITYVSQDDPPFLIMHGDRDDQVPLSQSQLLCGALREAGVAAELRVVTGAGHEFFGDPESEQKVGDFFDRWLKQAEVQ